MHGSSSLILLVTVIASVACSRHDSEGDARAAAPPWRGAIADTVSGGAVRIVSVDSGVDLALVRDSISGGLSQRTLAMARKSIDTATVKSSGLGASVERLVKSSVSSAIGTRVVVPLTAVKDIRYEDGKLQFDWNGKPVTFFENAKVNDKPVMESFRPEDAQRFVDVVRARKRALGQM
jgi:hypothetical protein